MTCDGLASHPGEVEILPAASCYRNRDKLRHYEQALAPRLHLYRFASNLDFPAASHSKFNLHVEQANEPSRPQSAIHDHAESDATTSTKHYFRLALRARVSRFALCPAQALQVIWGLAVECNIKTICS